jgi:hypothetical protein
MLNLLLREREAVYPFYRVVVRLTWSGKAFFGVDGPSKGQRPNYFTEPLPGSALGVDK